MRLMIVTYHYIDDEERYATGIFPISPGRLARQIELIAERFSFVSEDDLVGAIAGTSALPENACLLTFDDGLKSQFRHAVPLLEERGIPAVFFVSTRHLEGRACTVHKIHFLLSQVDAPVLLADLRASYAAATGGVFPDDKLDRKEILNWYRYDREPAAVFKYFLNHFAADKLSDELVDSLFSRHYPGSEQQFCDELYLSREELLAIDRSALLAVGLHGHEHKSTLVLSETAVAEDLRRNRALLKEAVGIKQVRGMSYPFGSLSERDYRDKISATAAELDLVYGCDTAKQFNTGITQPFLLHRFNPNDIPGGRHPVIAW